MCRRTSTLGGFVLGSYSFIARQVSKPWLSIGFETSQTPSPKQVQGWLEVVNSAVALQHQVRTLNRKPNLIVPHKKIDYGPGYIIP